MDDKEVKLPALKYHAGQDNMLLLSPTKQLNLPASH
jgi:hypothetical protein